MFVESPKILKNGLNLPLGNWRQAGSMSGHRATRLSGALPPSGLVQAESGCHGHLVVALHGAVEVHQCVRRCVVAPALVVRVVAPDALRQLLGAAAAEEVAVEVLAEGAADEVQSDRVDARVEEAEAEADDPERVPEFVVLFHRLRIQMEPHHEHVVRQEADEEDDDEGEHHFSNLLPGLHLRRVRRLTWHVFGALFQMEGHQDVEDGDHAQRYGVVHQEFQDDHYLVWSVTDLSGKGVAVDEHAVVSQWVFAQLGENGRGDCENHGHNPDPHGSAHGDGFGAQDAAGVSAQRIDDCAVAFGAQGRQREDRHADGQVLDCFRQFAYESAVGPRLERVQR